MHIKPAYEELEQRDKKLEKESVDHKRLEKQVLSVDDEKIFLDIGRHMLNNLGYEVLLANSGQDALEIYKENQDKIEIIIL